MSKYIVAGQYLFMQQNSTGYFWSKITSWLLSESSDVKVIGPIPEGAFDIAEGVEYELFEFSVFNRFNVLSRIFGQLKLSVLLFYKLFKSRKDVDTIILGTTPEVFLAIFPILKILSRNVKYVLVVHDVFPHTLIPAKILKNGFLFLILRKYFEFVYRMFSALVVIGRDMEDLFGKEIGVAAEKIFFISNWVAEDDVELKPKNDCQIIRDLKLSDKIVFQFFGNMGRVQGVESLIEAIKLVKNKKAVFIFCGFGIYVDLVEKYSRDEGLGQVYYLGYVKPAEKNNVLPACDVALVSLVGGMNGLAVPSKAYFSLAAGRPLLAIMSETSEVARLVVENKVGWVCDEDNPQKLANLIDEICEADFEYLSDRCRQTFEVNFSEKVARIKFMEIFKSLEKL